MPNFQGGELSRDLQFNNKSSQIPQSSVWRLLKRPSASMEARLAMGIRRRRYYRYSGLGSPLLLMKEHVGY
jgi:hypothetical protein